MQIMESIERRPNREAIIASKKEYNRNGIIQSVRLHFLKRFVLFQESLCAVPAGASEKFRQKGGIAVIEGIRNNSLGTVGINNWYSW